MNKPIKEQHTVKEKTINDLSKEELITVINQLQNQLQELKHISNFLQIRNDKLVINNTELINHFKKQQANN